MGPRSDLEVLPEIPVGDYLKRSKDTPGKPLKEAMSKKEVNV